MTFEYEAMFSFPENGRGLSTQGNVDFSYRKNCKKLFIDGGFADLTGSSYCTPWTGINMYVSSFNPYKLFD